jgi:hypothetical protein
MVVRDSTVPFHPVPKTRVIYELLKAFMKNIDLDGKFIPNDMMKIFNQLKTKGIISASYQDYYMKLVTTLAEKGVLTHHDGHHYSLSDDGYLTVLEWEDDFASQTDHIPIVNENATIKINYPLKVFLSCGDKDNEYPIANWLKKKLEENSDVNVYWWHEDPTNPLSHRPITSKLFKEIEDCDFFVGILHRRYCLPDGYYTTSVSCEDEFRWACFKQKSKIGFRQKQVRVEGMILDDMEIRAIENSDQIIEYLQKSIDEYNKNKTKII